MHLIDEACGFIGANPGVAQTISMAVGSALAFKLDGTSRVAVAFFGDAAVEAGLFWEAANFAALHKLPLMLVCENNTYATATPISARQPDTPIVERVSGVRRQLQMGVAVERPGHPLPRVLLQLRY